VCRVVRREVWPHHVCYCNSVIAFFMLTCKFSYILFQVSFSDWFMSKGGTRESITRMWDPVAYALGFIDCDNISARCMLTIFTLFATKTEASLLRMLKGSPDVYLSGPIKKYITDRGGRYGD
jgi:zeta-carotene desaturase